MSARVILTATLAALVACGGRHEAAVLAQPGAPGQTASTGQFSSVDQLVAPIALYPDQLLAQILLCAGDPASVTRLDVWLQNNPDLKGSARQDAAVRAGFEASFVALALFPQVVSRMALDLEWTAQLGNAFAANKTLVFDSIQKLRQQAQAIGTLKDTSQQDVEMKTTAEGQQVIVIEPANPQVVYVPQYNTQTVYTQAPSTTVVVHDDDSDEALAAGLIGFTAGVAIGAAFDNDYYYGPYGWHGGAYMYNDGWDDYWDAREDAREDWMDHREDIMEDRGDRAENRSEQRTDRAETRTDARGDRAAATSSTTRTDRTQAAQTAQQNRASGTSRVGSTEARGYSGSNTTRTPSADRSGTRSDAFSGYSSGASQRAASSRGQRSRSASRSGGGGRRR